MFKSLVIRPNVDEFNYLDYTDLVTFTEEILNGKLRFLCSVLSISYYIFLCLTLSTHTHTHTHTPARTHAHTHKHKHTHIS